MKSNAIALACAIVGGTLGYFAFSWLLSQGYYGLVLPGGLLGMGAGMVKNRSILVAIICGLLALALGLFTEWRHAPFNADPSLPYFLTHIHELKPLTLIMIGLGTFIGFWVPFRAKSRTYPATQSSLPDTK